jgi:hypothetical protein
MGNYCNFFSWFWNDYSAPSYFSKSLCNIQTSKITYSGFLINITFKEKNFFGLIAENKIITEEMINKKESIKFNYDNFKKNVTINLNKDERYMKNFTEKKIEIVIIEILSKDGIEESYFLKPLMNTNYEELKNKEIIILGNMGYLDGKIDNININQNECAYILTSDIKENKIKSGNPILLKDSVEVIGITGKIKKDDSKNIFNLLGVIFDIIKNENIGKIKEEKIIEGKKIELEDGGYYIGELTDDEIPNGKGKYFFKNGESYEGSIINDKFEGHGKYIYENGEFYIGEWKNDSRNGKGILYYKNGNIKYEGEFLNDKYEGKGKYTWENGEYYIGLFKNGLNNGKGILYYQNGKIQYEGDFLDDKFEGTGKYIYDDEQYYIGQFKNGLKNGKGVLYFKNGNIEYEGDFLEGKFDGEGKYVYENGDYYEGHFKNGLCDGKGKECDKNGNIICEGEWVNDEKI